MSQETPQEEKAGRSGTAPDSLSSLLTPVTLLGLAGYLFIGTAAVLIPSVMPSLTEEYLAAGLTLGTVGYIFWARAGAGIVGNLLAGAASDRIGYQRLVWIAALALAATLALTAAALPWLLFLAGFALISIAQASLTTGINAMIADANPDSRARALNVLHGVYAVGATISPLVFGFVLQLGVRWRWTVAATGLIWLVYGGIASLFYRSNGSTAGEGARGQGLDWGMLRNAGFLSLFLIAFIYNGVAYSLLAWVALFMQESAGLDTFASISSVSVFYVALTAGRFICAAFAERIGYARTLLILAVVLIVIYPLMLLSTDPAVLMIGVFLTGLSLSGLFPTALAYGSRLYPDKAGAVTGLLNVAMTAGAMLPPWWTGEIADIWSFQTALGINYSMAWILVGVCVVLGRLERRTTGSLG